MLNLGIELMERGLLPDWLVRAGVRRLCRDRLGSLHQSFGAQKQRALQAYARQLREGALAESTKEANAQHYEVPAEFFQSVLGSSRKYSCAYWANGCVSLDEAERKSLEVTADRAEVASGMRVLELGCGWGSLSLHLARSFPGAAITAVSNSRSQREFIEARAAEENLTNLKVLTLDLSRPEGELGLPEGEFDRVLSVEMFEHFKNYEILLGRVSKWLKPDGKLFVHIFTHKDYSYPFETEGDDNWMGKYFFTGGQMPSRELLPQFQDHLRLERRWDWGGAHYQRTAEAWLENLDRDREMVMRIFEQTYGSAEAGRWLERWRVFFISCAELFGFQGGNEWGVSHYLFTQKREKE